MSALEMIALDVGFSLTYMAYGNSPASRPLIMALQLHRG